VLLGTRKYVPCLYVFNKVDAVSIETIEEICSQNDGRNVVISAELGLGLDTLMDRIWDELQLVK